MGVKAKKIIARVLSYLQAKMVDIRIEKMPRRLTLTTDPPRFEACLQSFPNFPDSSPVWF